MRETCAIGSFEDCITTLRGFREAGADEIAIFGRTPADNAEMLERWRNVQVGSAA